MSKNDLRLFEESLTEITGYTILLDLDGTLLPDGDMELSDEVLAAVEKLQEGNDLYLVTNGHDVSRAEGLAQQLGIPVAPGGVPAGKPWLKAAAGIPTGKPFMVIGDMLTTDGLLAYRLKARFMRVLRKDPLKRRPYLRFSHFIDDVVSLFV